MEKATQGKGDQSYFINDLQITQNQAQLHIQSKMYAAHMSCQLSF